MTDITIMEVETAKLRSDIEKLSSLLQSIKKKSEELKAAIDSLNSMWEGEAKEAFVSDFNADYETLKSLEASTEALLGNLEAAMEDYNTCENDVGSLIDSIRI